MAVKYVKPVPPTPGVRSGVVRERQFRPRGRDGRDMDGDGEAELARIWTKVDAIRAKRATKLAYSPLPTAEAEGTVR